MESYGLCAECFKQIEFLDDNICVKCGLEFDICDHFEKICAKCLVHPPIFDRHLSATRYTSVIADMISDYKYHDQHLYHQFLVHILIRKITKFSENYDYIASVPMHWKKLFNRAFNQSDYLARAVADVESKQYKNLLVKIKNTKPQMSLGLSARQKNLKGAIAMRRNINVKGKNIVLIDDVFTTGATLNECAKVLKQNGANKVYCFTIAKTSKI
jgi:ComF family protein